MQKVHFWLAFGATLVFSHASATQDKPSRCAETPCPNTATGEDPQAINIREGAKLEARQRNNPDDKARWASTRIYSSTKKPERLKMQVVAASEFRMELDPGTGSLILAAPSRKHVFRIAAPAGTKDDLCPKYELQVLDADADFALVKKSCQGFEYAPGRYHKSADYYLYDAPTSTMRSIWAASLTTKAAPFPDADPEVTIKRVRNGYRFDWVGLFPSDATPVRQEIHNLYTRQPNSKKGVELVCRDARSKTNEGSEMCEDEVLELVQTAQR